MATRAASLSLAQLPNALTVLRLLMIPLFVVLLLDSHRGHSWPAALVFAAAGATDQIDGFLARRWRVESAFGKVADPLADRLMIDVAVVMLWVADRLPWPALALIVGRDLLLVVGYKLVVPRGYEFSVSLLGKVATWLLYAAVVLVLATPEEAEWPLWFFWAGVALAVAAGAFYVASAWREVRR